MRPVVGVMPLWDDEKQRVWMLPDYMNALLEAGCAPVLFPLTDDEEALKRLTAMVDGILFTGGHDVSPSVYGEAPVNDSVICCPMRDAMEKTVLAEAMALGKSVMGICRGIQFINAFLGGKLCQDIPTQLPSEVVHGQPKPYDVPVHKVTVMKGTPLYELTGAEELAVNSTHHQAVRAAAPGLVPMAAAPDGITEAVYKPDYKFLWAVQWHPEMLYKSDEPSRKIFRAFADSMR